MGVTYNPKIVTDGLILYVDPANPRSYDRRENLIAFSEDFNTWTKTRATISTNVTVAPDKTMTADIFLEDASISGLGFIEKLFTSINRSYCFSFYAKAEYYNQVSSYFVDSGGIVSSSVALFTVTGNGSISGSGASNASIENVGNGWYRCSISASTVLSGTANARIVHIGDTGVATRGIYVWGAQVERGTEPNTYIKTDASIVNRSSTLIDLTGNKNNGTISGDFSFSKTGLGMVNIDNLNSNALISFARNSTNNFNPTDKFTMMASAIVDTQVLTSLTGQVSVIFGRGATGGSFGIGFRENDDTSPSLISIGSRAVNVIGANLNYQYQTPFVATLSYDGESTLKQLTSVNGDFIEEQDISAGISGAFDQSDYAVFAANAVPGGNAVWAKGRVGPLLIYNRNLSREEIKINFAAFRGRYGL